VRKSRSVSGNCCKRGSRADYLAHLICTLVNTIKPNEKGPNSYLVSSRLKRQGRNFDRRVTGEGSGCGQAAQEESSSGWPRTRPSTSWALLSLEGKISAVRPHLGCSPRPIQILKGGSMSRPTAPTLPPLSAAPPRRPYLSPALEGLGAWRFHTAQSCPPGVPLCVPINSNFFRPEGGFPR